MKSQTEPEFPSSLTAVFKDNKNRTSLFYNNTTNSRASVHLDNNAVETHTTLSPYHNYNNTNDSGERRPLSQNLKEKLNRATVKAQLQFWRNKKKKEGVSCSTQNILYPYIGPTLNIPLTILNGDGTKLYPGNILFEAILINITDSEHNNEIKDKTEAYTFRIELKYGEVRWVVNRRLLDFIKLHSKLKIRHYRGKAPKIPSFPDVLSYAFQKAKISDEQRLSRLALNRRKALEEYMNKCMLRLNMKSCNELMQFLEVSALSFKDDMGWKGKEGYVQLKINIQNSSSMFNCFPNLIKEKWESNWLILRDSYIAISKKIDDICPSDIYLFINSTRIDTKSELSVNNPLKRDVIVISDNKTKIELKFDNHNVFCEWLNQIQFSIDKSLFTKHNKHSSFSPIRNNIWCSWYVDAADYYYDLSNQIENAKKCIYILDWWLSPELYLRRPPSLHEEYRIDRLLKRKAEQGVNIYIIVYKEVTISLPIDSSHTKTTLKNLHPLIKVQRHPDHVQNATLFWAHHEKLAIIDGHTAFMGGLDLCFGRFDNNAHTLADHSPDKNYNQIWPGQDYSNARIKDFDNIRQPYQDSINRERYPKMGWHDIALQTKGRVAKDLARHFVSRWNFIKSVKAKNRKRVPYLTPPAERSVIPVTPIELESVGNMDVQLLRSCAEWSSGIKKEHSIYNAYVDLILKANHFVYIENQFFVSLAKNDTTYRVKNQIAKALVDRIIQAHEEQKKFKVIIIIPLLPAFSNELNAGNAYTIRLIMHYQFCSISKGEHSIFQQLKNRNIDPHEYISFYGLRNYDLIPNSHNNFNIEVEDSRNKENLHANIMPHSPKKNENNPRIELNNENDQASNSSSSSNDNESRRKTMFSNHTGMFKPNTKISNIIHKTSSSMSNLNIKLNRKNKKNPTQTDITSNDTHNTEIHDNENNNNFKRKESVLTQNINDTNLNNINKKNGFENITSKNESLTPTEETKVENIIKSIRSNQEDQMEEEEKKQEIQEEQKEQEEMQYVTEEVYIHSKLMIIDDLIVVIGSANINDRSMLGNRDSEIALVIEDKELIHSKMNGKDYRASKYAHSLRTNLCKEHLGLLNNINMQDIIKMRLTNTAVNIKQTNHKHTDNLVKDPLSEQFLDLWKSTAQKNTEIYRDVFKCLPDDTVTSWEEYKKFTKNTQHVPYSHPETKNKDTITQNLNNINGHLVEFPTNFLKNENLSTQSFSAESFAPDEIFT